MEEACRSSLECISLTKLDIVEDRIITSFVDPLVFASRALYGNSAFMLVPSLTCPRSTFDDIYRQIIGHKIRCELLNVRVK